MQKKKENKKDVFFAAFFFLHLLRVISYTAGDEGRMDPGRTPNGQ